jgi:hypothetical protein
MSSLVEGAKFSHRCTTRYSPSLIVHCHIFFSVDSFSSDPPQWRPNIQTPPTDSNHMPAKHTRKARNRQDTTSSRSKQYTASRQSNQSITSKHSLRTRCSSNNNTRSNQTPNPSNSLRCNTRPNKARARMHRQLRRRRRRKSMDVVRGVIAV